MSGGAPGIGKTQLGCVAGVECDLVWLARTQRRACLTTPPAPPAASNSLWTQRYPSPTVAWRDRPCTSVRWLVVVVCACLRVLRIHQAARASSLLPDTEGSFHVARVSEVASATVKHMELIARVRTCAWVGTIRTGPCV